MPADRHNEVRAAGGIPWRRTADGRVEVLVVHRPQYDDWTFPKGKAEAGEPDEVAAVREVAEETGLSLTLGQELPSVRYVDNKGRPKIVRYWAMAVPATNPVAHTDDRALSSPCSSVPNDEVDRLAWAAVDDAGARLSYERDRELLGPLVRLLTAT